MNDPKEVELAISACSYNIFDLAVGIVENYLERVHPDERRLQLFHPVVSAAIEANRPDVVASLFSLGCPWNILHVWSALGARSTEMLKVLLHYGWDINEPERLMTPPTLFRVVKDWELTNWFLDHGANPNARCYMDDTPLSTAVKVAPLEIIRLLFDRGGSVDRGQLIHYAIERDSEEIAVVEFLLKKGASLNVTKYHNDPRSFNQHFFMGLGTPLHGAASLGKVDVVSYLLSKGADCSIQDSNGRTALECAKKYKHLEVASLLENASEEDPARR